ncbi:MAG: LuxR family transcriptional regulator, partial [Desulfobacteraceae bacterium]|nr:LuxR family transcriptional regulator [Desulfobacteraceae bacterium]
MRINEELNREINEIKSNNNENLERISLKLRGRIKELSCLYDISSFREGNDFSLDSILQEMVDFIPPACQYPEITGARIIIDGYEFSTKNFEDTGWKHSFNITVENKQIGILEVCRLEKIKELDKELFLEEEKSLINAIAQGIALLAEREWAEEEIRKCRN